MNSFELAIAWNWEFDQDFIHGIEVECAQRGVSTYQITPQNLEHVIGQLASGLLQFAAYYDRASDADEGFLPLVEMLKAYAIHVINPHDRVAHAIDKATMHLEFMTHGLNVPKTLIVPPFNTDEDLASCKLDLEMLGKPFVVKPANTTGGGTGVFLNAQAVEDIMERRQEHKDDKYLLQEMIHPKDLDGKRAWFRVYSAFTEILPCWWDDKTHKYSELSPDEESRHGLSELRAIMSTIEEVCGLDFFSSEIAQTEDGRFTVVDYVNEICDMRLQSKYTNGAPDAVVHRIEKLIAQEIEKHVHQLAGMD